MSNLLCFRKLNLVSIFRQYATANRIKQNEFPKTPRQLRNKPTPFESFGASVKDKGYLRSLKPYTPPANVTEMVHEICSSLDMSCSGDHELTNSQDKFHLLNECFTEFKHSVPNSTLFEIQTIGILVLNHKQTLI